MNIFILDEDHKLSAEYHVDKHIVKMPLELAQLLCTAHHLSGTDPKIVPYRATHNNHPCSIWTRTSKSNYLWLCKLGLELCYEYTYRYGKVHKCQSIIEWCSNNVPKIPDIDLTPFAQAMPEELKDPDPIKAYRQYYNRDKKHLFSWKHRKAPQWAILS